MTAASPDSSRKNCFDLLRLLLASLVVYTHTYFIGGFGGEGFMRFNRDQTSAGALAVLGFFGLSGYLIGDSFLRCPGPVTFMRRRVLRIMPGFWGCLVFTAVVIAPAMEWIERGSLAGFRWGMADGAASYVVHNIFLRIHQWGVADVLGGAIYPGSLNGSLWSLFPEFCCYLILLFAGLCGLMAGNRLWLLVFTGLLAVFHGLAIAGGTLPAHTLPTLIALTPLSPYVLAFFVGASCRAFHEYVPLGGRGAIFFSLLTLVLLHLGGWRLTAPIVMPLLLLNLGRAFTVHLRHDFSYGIYIYAFPCQQLLALAPALRSSALVFFLASSVLTTAVAMASWFGIERRFLQRAHRQ